jgi:hypothetical protein
MGRVTAAEVNVTVDFIGAGDTARGYTAVGDHDGDGATAAEARGESGV